MILAIYPDLQHPDAPSLPPSMSPTTLLLYLLPLHNLVLRHCPTNLHFLHHRRHHRHHHNNNHDHTLSIPLIWLAMFLAPTEHAYPPPPFSPLLQPHRLPLRQMK